MTCNRASLVLHVHPNVPRVWLFISDFLCVIFMTNSSALKSNIHDFAKSSEKLPAKKLMQMMDYCKQQAIFDAHE